MTRWNKRLCSSRSLRLLRSVSRGERPTPAGAARPAAHSPGPLRQPRRGLETFPAPTPTPPPASRWERVGLAAGSALAVTPTRFSVSPRRGGPRLAPKSHGGTEAPGAERGRSGTPRFGQGKGQLAACRDPVAFPGVTCSLAGVSRSSRPLPALSPHAVAHAGFSAGPHAPEVAVGRLLHAAAPNRGVPGSTAPAARHRELLDLPWGALCPTPASPQSFRARGEGGGQARGARDSARPETSPAGGAEGGGGHRHSYSWITRSSQLGPAPRSLSLTCLTPPRPGPAPFLPLGVAAPRPPDAPGAHVTDGTAPRAGPGFLIGFSQGAYRPLGPTQPGARPAVCLPGERPGIMRPQPPRLRARQSLPSPSRAPAQAPPSGEGPLDPLRNSLAQSR